MAKLFLIIICVCATCVHLACAQIARKTPQLSGLTQIHRHDVKLGPQGQQRLVLNPAAAEAASDLEYGKQIKTQLENTKQNYGITKLHRNKRHAGHSHGVADAADAHPINHIEVNPSTAHFIEKLFEQFSNGDSKTMNLVEFENLMKHLGLNRLIDDKQFNNAIQTLNESRSNSGIADGDNHENNSPNTHSNDTVSRIQ